MRTIAMASLLGFAAIANGQIDSGFDLHVTNGNQVRVPIILDAPDSELLTYDLQSGLMSLDAGDVIGGDYDEPLFCFDFGDPLVEPVVLDVRDANGHVIMSDVGLGTALKYRLAEDEIGLTVPSSAQCFFNDSEGDLKLFGRTSSGSRANDACKDAGTDCLFSTAFAAYADLSIEYENLSGNAPGDLVEYDIKVINTGDADANELALQEVFPSDSNIYSAVLTEGQWVCSDDAQGFCPDPEGDQSNSGSGPLRFQGLELPAGASMTFHVIREIPDDESQAGHTIHLNAAVVNGTGSAAEHDVAEAQFDVIGEATALKFDTHPAETTLGGTIQTSTGDPIVVHVVDSNGNLVSDDNSTSVIINLIDPFDVRQGSLTSSVQVTNGEVSFSNLSTEGLDVDTGYRLEAEATTVSIDRGYSNNFDIININ